MKSIIRNRNSLKISIGSYKSIAKDWRNNKSIHQQSTKKKWLNKLERFKLIISKNNCRFKGNKWKNKRKLEVIIVNNERKMTAMGMVVMKILIRERKVRKMIKMILRLLKNKLKKDDLSQNELTSGKLIRLTNKINK